MQGGSLGKAEANGETPNDDTLLAAVASGDRDAFQLLMLRHGKKMLGLAERVTGNAADADEIVQEAFLATWKTAPRWDAQGRARFTTWLYRVVLNACIDRLRRPYHAPLEDAGDPIDPAPGSVERVAAAERRRLVTEALQDVPERQRKALVLAYFVEVSGTRAAQILDLSRPALDALLVRGRQALKAALSKRGITRFGDLA